MSTKVILIIATVYGVLAVIFGAFGAHLLEDRLSTAQLDTFETGVRYQMYHALALIALAILKNQKPHRIIDWAGFFWILGIFLFSGSLYLLSFSETLPLFLRKVLGPITPLGGTCLIIGWIQLLRYALKLPD